MCEIAAGPNSTDQRSNAEGPSEAFEDITSHFETLNTSKGEPNANPIHTQYRRTFSEDACKFHRDTLLSMLNIEGNWEEAHAYARELSKQLDLNEPNYETREDIFVYNNLKQDLVAQDWISLGFPDNENIRKEMIALESIPNGMLHIYTYE